MRTERAANRVDSAHKDAPAHHPTTLTVWSAPPGLIRRRDPHLRVLPPGVFKLSPPRGWAVDGSVLHELGKTVLKDRFASSRKARPGFAAPFVPIEPEEYRPLRRLRWRNVREVVLLAAALGAPFAFIHYAVQCDAGQTCLWSEPPASNPIVARASP
jgi:hypothetical protein